MFKKILVALCGDGLRSTAAEQAVNLAVQHQANLRAVYVIDRDDLIPPSASEGIDAAGWRELVQPELESRGRKVLEQFAARCAQAGVLIECALAVGSFGRVLQSESRAADLVIATRCPKLTTRRLFFGRSHLETLLRQDDPPVLVLSAA